MGFLISMQRSACRVAGIPAALILFSVLASSLAAAQANPANVQDLANAASAALEQNDVSHAIELYDRITRIDPQWPDAWWFLGSLQYGAGAYPEARDALSRYINLMPDAGPAIAMRGLCEFESGDYAEALKDIQHGLARGAANQPRNAKILRYHEALLLTRLGRFDDALRAYSAFARDPDPNPELLVAIGLAGLRTPLLPRELKTDRQEVFAAAGKAALDFMRGDQDGARAEFQALFRRTPPPANAHYLYGFLLYADDADQALAEFQSELQVSPSSSAAEVMLAWIFLLQDHPADALSHAEKAIAEEPGSVGAQLVLGRALALTGDVNRGIQYLEKALQADPDNLEVHIALARAYSKVGRKDDARRERLLCLEMTKNDAMLPAHP